MNSDVLSLMENLYKTKTNEPSYFSHKTFFLADTFEADVCVCNFIICFDKKLSGNQNNKLNDTLKSNG